MNVKPTKMATHQSLEDPSKTPQHRGSSRKDQCSPTSYAGVQEVILDEVATKGAVIEEDSGRERLKKRRIEMASVRNIPDTWGQEELLKDWIDCSAFDDCLAPSGIMSARQALVEEGRRASFAALQEMGSSRGKRAHPSGKA